MMLDAFDRVTCPIYSETAAGLDHEGTIALVRSQKSIWAITACHVVVGIPATRFWIGGNPLQPLGDETICYSPSPADVAFFRLSREKANAVHSAGARFLSLDSLGSYEEENVECVVTGYPYRSSCDPAVQINRETGVITAQQMVYRSVLLSKEALGFVPNIMHRIHVAVRANQMQEVEKMKNIPLKNFDFKGLSGGIIWQKQSDSITRAVAIVTDHDPKQKLLIGTVIAPLIYKMAERFGRDF